MSGPTTVDLCTLTLPLQIYMYTVQCHWNLFPLCTNRYQTLAVATDANTKEDIGNKKVSGKKLTVIIRRIGCIMYLFIGLRVMLHYRSIIFIFGVTILCVSFIFTVVHSGEGAGGPGVNTFSARIKKIPSLGLIFTEENSPPPPIPHCPQSSPLSATVLHEGYI